MLDYTRNNYTHIMLTLIFSILFYVLYEFAMNIINTIREERNNYQYRGSTLVYLKPVMELTHEDIVIFLLTTIFLQNNWLAPVYVTFTIYKIVQYTNFIISGHVYIKYALLPLFVILTILIHDPFSFIPQHLEYAVRISFIGILALKFSTRVLPH